MPEYQPGAVLFEIFRVERLLGMGTFGRVYLVRNLKLDDLRALKILRNDDPGIGSSDIRDCRERFLMEAKLAARRSDNLIQVYSQQEDAHNLAVEMEYAPGGSLKDRLLDLKENKRRMPVDECLAIAGDIARGLKTLHERDIVHRDLKPGNILFDDQGRAKISDLGLAQTDLSTSRLVGGSLLPRPHPGTPGYMSPEHGSPEKYPHLPPASDIYALGCILFEMLTGAVYKNQRPGTLITQFRQDGTSWLSGLLAKMLEKDPEKRPWNGNEALEEIQRGRAGQQRVEKKVQSGAEPKAETERQQQDSEGAKRQARAQVRLENEKKNNKPFSRSVWRWLIGIGILAMIVWVGFIMVQNRKMLISAPTPAGQIATDAPTAFYAATMAAHSAASPTVTAWPTNTPMRIPAPQTATLARKTWARNGCYQEFTAIAQIPEGGTVHLLPAERRFDTQSRECLLVEYVGETQTIVGWILTADLK